MPGPLEVPTEPPAERPRSRGRPRKDHTSTINEDILRIATEMFGERGYVGTSMDAIAAAAGISKRTLYTRYPDKATLFRDVIDTMINAFKDPGPAEFGDLRACLQFHVESYFIVTTDPSICSFHSIADMAEQHLPEMAVITQQLTFELGIKRIGHSIATTALKTNCPVADPEFIAASLLDLAKGHCARVQALGLRNDFASFKQAAERIVNLLMSGIAVPSA